MPSTRAINPFSAAIGNRITHARRREVIELLKLKRAQRKRERAEFEAQEKLRQNSTGSLSSADGLRGKAGPESASRQNSYLESEEEGKKMTMCALATYRIPKGAPGEMSKRLFDRRT